MYTTRLGLGVTLLLAGVFASASTLRAQQDTTTARRDTVQQDTTRRQIPTGDLREPERILTGTDLIEDSFPGSWPMFGKNFRMKIGGYVKADYLYDLNGTLDRRQFLMSTIPVEGTPEHANSGYVSLFAAETRFNIDVRRIAAGRPPLRLFLEGDFWPSGQALRLRHAYVVFGDFLAGQTWTTLSILESLASAIDFASGDALFGGRTSQIRYQRRLSERWKLAVGLESLDYMGIENTADQAGEPSLGLPLLAARVDYQWKSGLAVLGSSAAQLRWDGGAVGPNATALQWDVVFAGRQYVGADYVTWNVSYGRGSGENIMAFGGSNANAVLTAAGTLETMPAFAFVAGFVHKWSAQVVSNLSYAYGWLDAPPARDPAALKRGGVGHVNVIWRPVPEFATGLEYMYGAQRTTGDALGQASRIQGMFRFDF